MLKSRGCDIGRYYSGDIDGKFWFAVQPSDAASKFGGEVHEPEYIEYYFCEDDLEDINKELAEIESKNKKEFKLLDEFFDKNESYTDEKLAEEAKLDLTQVKKSLRDYADYKLGIKIRDHVIEFGECNFEAEL